MTTEYRILDPKEPVQQGDEYWLGGEWNLSGNWNSSVNPNCDQMQDTPYRRPMPSARPWFPQWQCTRPSGCPVHVLWAESPPIVRTVTQIAAEAKPEALEPKPEPGTGYRLLGDDEIVQRGDEWYNPGPKGDWSKATGSVGNKVSDMVFVYRRKLEIPGEGYVLVPLGEIIQTGDEWLQADGSWRVTGLPGGSYQHRHALDTLRRKKPVPEPEYRPYANAAEAAEGLQGKLIVEPDHPQNPGCYYPVNMVTPEAVRIESCFWNFLGLLKYWKFADGTPCGVLITNQGTK